MRYVLLADGARCARNGTRSTIHALRVVG
jgi:hypothetical protein